MSHGAPPRRRSPARLGLASSPPCSADLVPPRRRAPTGPMPQRRRAPTAACSTPTDPPLEELRAALDLHLGPLPRWKSRPDPRRGGSGRPGRQPSPRRTIARLRRHGRGPAPPERRPRREGGSGRLLRTMSGRSMPPTRSVEAGGADAWSPGSAWSTSAPGAVLHSRPFPPAATSTRSRPWGGAGRGCVAVAAPGPASLVGRFDNQPVVGRPADAAGCLADRPGGRGDAGLPADAAGQRRDRAGARRRPSTGPTGPPGARRCPAECSGGLDEEDCAGRREGTAHVGLRAPAGWKGSTRGWPSGVRRRRQLGSRRTGRGPRLADRRWRQCCGGSTAARRRGLRATSCTWGRPTVGKEVVAQLDAEDLRVASLVSDPAGVGALAAGRHPIRRGLLRRLQGADLMSGVLAARAAPFHGNRDEAGRDSGELQSCDRASTSREGRPSRIGHLLRARESGGPQERARSDRRVGPGQLVPIGLPESLDLFGRAVDAPGDVGKGLAGIHSRESLPRADRSPGGSPGDGDRDVGTTRLVRGHRRRKGLGGSRTSFCNRRGAAPRGIGSLRTHVPSRPRRGVLRSRERPTRSARGFLRAIEGHRAEDDDEDAERVGCPELPTHRVRLRPIGRASLRSNTVYLPHRPGHSRSLSKKPANPIPMGTADVGGPMIARWWNRDPSEPCPRPCRSTNGTDRRNGDVSFRNSDMTGRPCWSGRPGL